MTTSLPDGYDIRNNITGFLKTFLRASFRFNGDEPLMEMKIEISHAPPTPTHTCLLSLPTPLTGRVHFFKSKINIYYIA